MKIRRVSLLLILVFFFGAGLISRNRFLSARAAPIEPLRTQTDLSGPLPFIAISPCRKLDTRISGGPILSGVPRDIVLTGPPCGVPSGATAVSANFAVFDIVGASGNGVLTVYPTGNPSATVALVNWAPSSSQIDNACIVPVGVGGAITLTPQQGSGSVDVVIDITGYFSGNVITGVSPGTGLTGGGTSGVVTLGIANSGVGTSQLADASVTAAKVSAFGSTNGQILVSNGSTVSWQTPSASGFVRTVVVSPVPGDALASGTAFLNALAGITDASLTNPYLLKLEPGVFDLGSSTLLTKTSVDIEGSASRSRRSREPRP